MTFDPDKFIAQRHQPSFDPDAFINSKTEQLAPQVPEPEQEQGPTMELVSDLDKELLQGLTFGFGDEAAAALGALTASLTTGANFSDAYKGMVGDIRSQQNHFREEHPVASTAAQAVGGLLSGGAGIAKATTSLAPKGAGLAKNLLVGTGTGAVEGGIAGAGFADDNKIEAAKDGALIGGGLGFLGGAAVGAISKRSIIKDEVADLFKKDRGNTKLAKYVQDGAGRVKKDPAAIEAIRQGYDEGVIATIKGSSKRDKLKLGKMIDVLEEGKDNKRFGMVNMPSDVVGDSIAERVRHIEKINKLSGAEVRRASRGLKGKQVDFAPSIDQLLADLDDAGVNFDPKSGRVDFVGSDFEELEGAEGAIRRVLGRMRNNAPPDAFEVHRLKKYIDNNVEFGKSNGGAVGQAEGIIKDLRHNLDAALDGKFKGYDVANTTYSETKNALNNFKSLSAKIDIDSDNVDKSLGAVARRISSHAVSKGGVLDVIEGLDTVAAKYDGNFSDDIITQALFADELNTVFGPTARTSLQGEGAKIAKGAANAASGNALDMAAGAVGGIYDKVRGVNNEKAIKVIRDILER